MGIVTNHLRNLIERQIDLYGIVVWYDPEGHFSSIAAELSIPDLTVAKYTNSFYALRNEIEPLLNGTTPPRLLVYVPMEQTETSDALYEIETFGTVMRPGQQPPSKNTRLSLVARNALKSIVGEDSATAIEKSVELGKLSLAELDGLAEAGQGISKGVVAVIFGSVEPQQVALEFLAGDRYDSDIVSKNAAGEWALLLNTAYESDLVAEQTPEEMRNAFARHILVTEFKATLRGQPLDTLARVSSATKHPTISACVDLVRTWRLRRDKSDSYAEQAEKVEAQLRIQDLALTLDQCHDIQTFHCTERKLLELVQEALQAQSSEDLVRLCDSRQASFWSSNDPSTQHYWKLTMLAGQVLLASERVETSLKIAASDASFLLHAYTDGDEPWCLLDTYHRNMERQFHLADLSTTSSALERLVNKARSRYTEVASVLAESFVRGFQAGRFKTPEVLQQRSIFTDKVRPYLEQGKTAYFLVDALRFEMARELAQSLRQEFDLTIEPAIAAVPTITEVGMCSLMPIGEQRVSIVQGGEGKLALKVKDTVIKDRRDRIKYLKENVNCKVFDLTIEELLPVPKRRVKEGIANADLILVTSQEIDLLCESDNVPLARRTMDDMLRDLSRAIRVLRDHGVHTVLVTADHGFIFGEDLGSEMLIEAPGGQTLDLHRRVWVGSGGTAGSAFLRAPISDFGYEGDYEIAVPYNLACFKVAGGAKAYFHGGLSPQELIIPLLRIVIGVKETRLPAEIDWTMKPGSTKISTRFFSVQVVGYARSLLSVIPPRIRVEVRAKGECISKPISASYGYNEATGDVQLRLAEDNQQNIDPNTVTLQIEPKSEEKTVSVHLLDDAGVELNRVGNIEMAIAI